MRHVHAGTTDPPKEGANARSWMAPATVGSETAQNGINPQGESKKGSFGDGVGWPENGDNG